MSLGTLVGSKEGIKRFDNETDAFNVLASLVKITTMNNSLLMNYIK